MHQPALPEARYVAARPCPSPAEDLSGFLAWHAALFGDVRMEETDEERTAREEREKAGRTFSQDSLDRAAARARDEGRRSAQRELLASLGLPEDAKPEDIKAKLEAAQKAEDAQKSEAQRARDEAAAAKADADKEKAGAAEERHLARVERLLERAGVGADEDDDEKREKAVARAAKLLDVEVGADSDKIKAAIKSLKEDVPALFGEVKSTEGTPDGDSGRPGTRSAGGGGKVSGVAKGRDEAEKRGWVTKKSA